MAAFDRYEWLIDFEDDGERVDKFLANATEEISRSQIQKWIKEGLVFVNGSPVKGNYRLNEDDSVSLNVPPQVKWEIRPEEMPLNIVYEDDDVIVVNKPRGMVVHPAPGHYTGTLVNGLLHYGARLSNLNGSLRPGIVHRIDKDTSGLIMVAKSNEAHKSLAEQLKQHTVDRTYIAIARGVIEHERGTIDAPIGRDPKNRKRMAVNFENGKRAITRFATLERFENHTLVELKLETGRTHQIRVHMKYIGFPLVGDPKYGSSRRGENIDGQALHASGLSFIHPTTGRRLTFSAPMPADMERVLQQFRQ